MRSLASVWGFVSLIALGTIAASGCKPKGGGGDSSASADASAGSEAKAPGVECADLPGAIRVQLMVSEDGKTLSWLEVAETEEGRRWDLYSLTVGEKSPKKLAEGVDDVFMAGKGRHVFTRDKAGDKKEYDRKKELVLVDASGTQKVLVEDERGEGRIDLKYSFFELDAATDTLWMQSGLMEAAKKIPLAGGAPTDVKLNDKAGAVVAFSPDGKTAYASIRYIGGVCKLDLASPEKECAPAGPQGKGYMFVDGGALYRNEATKAFHTTKLDNDTGKAASWAEADDTVVGQQEWKHAYVLRKKDKKSTLLKATLDKAEPLFTVTDLEIAGAAALADGRVAALLRQPNEEREADVCFIRDSGDIAVDTRKVSKAIAPAIPAITALLTGDLANAKVTSQPGKYPRVKLEAPGNGPADPVALRKRIEEIQKQISDATKQPNVGVFVEWTGNGKQALSTWLEGGDKFYLAGGDKDKMLFDRTQYAVELDPGSLFTYTRESSSGGDKKRFGSYDCKGTVKNLGTAPAKLEIQCTVATEFLGRQVKREELKPSPLPPSGTAKFDFYAGSGNEDDGVDIVVLMDGKRVPHFNAFAERKALGQTK